MGTRYNYVLAVSQLAAYLGEHLSDTGAASNPTLVDGRQVVAFQAWVIETWSAGTGLNKYKALQQFFRWLVAEGEIVRSPMSEVCPRHSGHASGTGLGDVRVLAHFDGAAGQAGEIIAPEPEGAGRCR